MTAAVKQSACVLLIGMRGCGKSSIGLALARRTDRAFIDLDDLAARVALNDPAASRNDIPRVFQALGEPAFRAAESRALADALDEPHPRGVILALGGGTPTAPGAEPIIQSARAGRRALVVYLRADAALLRSRLSGDGAPHRPSLTGRPVPEEIESLLAHRAPIYERLADFTVDVCADDAPDDAAQRVERALAS